jgi:ketosteroid isomerase-like protein
VVSAADEATLPLRPAVEVLGALPSDAGPGTRVVTAWFVALSEGRFDDALAMMEPDGAYFLLRQRKTITNADFAAIMKGLVGPTFTQPIAWSLGPITEQGDRVAAIAGSSAPLATGGSYENLYHFLFRLKGGRIVDGYEFADTFRSAQTFAAPPGEG